MWQWDHIEPDVIEVDTSAVEDCSPGAPCELCKWLEETGPNTGTP